MSIESKVDPVQSIVGASLASVLLIGLGGVVMMRFEVSSLRTDNANLRKRLAYWECTDRTPEKPCEPTLAEGEK